MPPSHGEDLVEYVLVHVQGIPLPFESIGVRLGGRAVLSSSSGEWGWALSGLTDKPANVIVLLLQSAFGARGAGVFCSPQRSGDPGYGGSAFLSMNIP